MCVLKSLVRCAGLDDWIRPFDTGLFVRSVVVATRPIQEESIGNHYGARKPNLVRGTRYTITTYPTPAPGAENVFVVARNAYGEGLGI